MNEATQPSDKILIGEKSLGLKMSLNEEVAPRKLTDEQMGKIEDAIKAAQTAQPEAKLTTPSSVIDESAAQTASEYNASASYKERKYREPVNYDSTQGLGVQLGPDFQSKPTQFAGGGFGYEARPAPKSSSLWKDDFSMAPSPVAESFNPILKPDRSFKMFDDHNFKEFPPIGDLAREKILKRLESLSPDDRLDLFKKLPHEVIKQLNEQITIKLLFSLIKQAENRVQAKEAINIIKENVVEQKTGSFINDLISVVDFLKEKVSELIGGKKP